MKPGRRIRRLASLAAVTALTLTGMATAVNLWLVHSARPRIGTPESLPVPGPFPVAIVPGARVHEDGRPTVALAERLDTALHLYRAGVVEKILVSGDPDAPEYDEVVAMDRYLAAAGVPASDRLRDPAGRRTIETMQNAWAVFGIDRAAICTQEFHLPRALFLARRAGIDAVGVKPVSEQGRPSLRLEVREFLARTLAFVEF